LDAQGKTMPAVALPMTHSRCHSRCVVDPAVFAERLLSRDALERVHLPEDDLLGLRNRDTGETLFVRESGFRRWLLRRN
jgi:hypothetical protein